MLVDSVQHFLAWKDLKCEWLAALLIQTRVTMSLYFAVATTRGVWGGLKRQSKSFDTLLLLMLLPAVAFC